MEKDKRYLVFQYRGYYPNGGIGDLIESFDYIQEAIEFINRNEGYYEFHHIYDRVEGVDVELN